VAGNASPAAARAVGEAAQRGAHKGVNRAAASSFKGKT
jgi:hypothetical protein